MALQALATVTTLMRPPDFLRTLKDCACNIDPPAASYVIMRRQAFTAERTVGPDRGELDIEVRN
jgi:hypothetical protein